MEKEFGAYDDENEAKLFIENLVKVREFYPQLKISQTKIDSCQNLVWQTLLTNPRSTYEGISSDSDSDSYSKDNKVERCAKVFFDLVQDVLQAVTLQKYRVQRDELILDDIVVLKEKGFGVITAARKLEKENLFKSIISNGFVNSAAKEFYQNSDWRNFIGRACSKLRLIGLQNKTVYIKDLYIEPDFSHEEKKCNFNELKEKINKSSSGLFIIKGQSGYGKTSLLKYLALLCYQQEIKKGFIPVYISLRQSLFKDDVNKGIFDRYLSILQEEGRQIDGQKLSNILSDGKALILIDGLGLNPSYRNVNHYISLVEQFIKQFPKNIYIISSKYSPEDDRINKAEPYLLNVLLGEIQQISPSSSEKNNFINEFSLQGFTEKNRKDFIGKYINKFNENSTRKSSTSEVQQEKIISNLEYCILLESPLLLSCFCFSCAHYSFPNIGKPNTEELLQTFIKEVTGQWDSGNDPNFHNIPFIINPYLVIPKDLKIQLLGFLATKFMLGEDEEGNQLGMPIEQQKVEEWLVNFVKNPEDFLTTSKNSSDINSLKKLFQRTHEDITDTLKSNDDDRDAYQKIAFLIIESIKSQHGLIVEKGSELVFIHSDIQKFLVLPNLLC
jgi:AAA domain